MFMFCAMILQPMCVYRILKWGISNFMVGKCMGGNLSLRGVWGPPPRKLRNMKYSGSYSKPIGPIFQPLFGLNLGPYFVNKLLMNNNLLSKYSSYQTQIKYAKLVNDAIENLY